MKNYLVLSHSLHVSLWDVPFNGQPATNEPCAAFCANIFGFVYAIFITSLPLESLLHSYNWVKIPFFAENGTKNSLHSEKLLWSLTNTASWFPLTLGRTTSRIRALCYILRQNFRFFVRHISHPLFSYWKVYCDVELSKNPVFAENRSKTLFSTENYFARSQLLQLTDVVCAGQPAENAPSAAFCARTSGFSYVIFLTPFQMLGTSLNALPNTVLGKLKHIW